MTHSATLCTGLSLLAAFSLALLGCGEAPVDPTRLFVRWITAGIVWGDLDEHGQVDAWCLEEGTSSRSDALVRYGTSLDGAWLCVVRQDYSLEVRKLGTSTSASMEPIELPGLSSGLSLEGCVADAAGNILAYSAFGNLVITVRREAGRLRMHEVLTFSGPGGLGPKGVEVDANSKVAVAWAIAGPLQTWVTDESGWRLREAQSEGDLAWGATAVGNKYVVRAGWQSPRVLIHRIDSTGGLGPPRMLSLPNRVGDVVVSPDDRFAWLLSSETVYRLDLETEALVSQDGLQRCTGGRTRVAMQRGGYVMLGRDAPDVVACELDEQGELLAVTPFVRPSAVDSDDDALGIILARPSDAANACQPAALAPGAPGP